jgi:hypothetical protein
MHRFTVDYSKDRPDPRTLMNRGFFLNGLPRIILLCRLFGHRPVVDGYDSQYGDRDRARWVNCDRCGIRPHPQGTLDPDQWQLGRKYTGPFNPTQPTDPAARKKLASMGMDEGIRLPGAWPAKPTSDVGCQLIIGRSLGGFSMGFKVGNPTSEQCLAGHISLSPLGALYVHTEDHGRFVQRRLNNTKWESRETELRVWHGRLEWRLWAPRDHSKKSDPWWMRGEIPLDPRRYLFGKVTNRKMGTTPKMPATVRMPDGDSYDITVSLECWSTGRQRGRRREHWTAEWEYRPGIPYRNGDSYFSGNHPIQHVTADTPNWPDLVAASVADSITHDRARNDYRHTAA